MNLRGFITHKLEEQTEFVRWWKETVGVNHGGNRRGDQGASSSTLKADDAESLTGITKEQVSKWAKKLQKPDQYRAQLFGAAYILSANVHRRHLNKGQQAMVTAMAKPDGEKGGRGKLSQNRESFSKTELNAIAQARFVLRNNLIPDGQQYPDRCLAVMAERIQARAIRRCGELLKQIEPGKTGPKTELHDATVMQLNRTEAARDAGISKRQKVTGCDPRYRGSADELIREKRRAEWPFCELCYNSHPVVILGPPLIGGRPAHWIGSSAASSSEFMNRFIGQHAREHPRLV